MRLKPSPSIDAKPMPRLVSTWLVRMWQWLAPRLPGWICQWQFWVVVALGALVRLPGASRSPFGSDDALLFLEAARTTHDHLLPVTGIYNSLLALNFPAYTFLLLPFANQPQGMAVLTVLLNIVAIVCLYVFATTAFGKWPALLAGMLFATAPYDTWMSVFIWQQTIVIPLTLLALLLAFEGAVRQRRHWFAPHVVLLALAVQIYPQTASLLPVTVLAVICGWRAIRWIDVLIAENLCVLIWLPTLLFELASGGYDLPIYARWLRIPKMTDGQALALLQQALGPQAGDYLGAGTWYAHIAPALAWLGPLLMVLWALSVLWIGAHLVAPLARAARARDLRGLWRATQAAGWRSRLLLMLWPLTLLAVTVRHATPVYIHYVFFITPVIFVMIALLLVEAPIWLAHRLRWRWAARAAHVVATATGGALVLAQACATVVFVLVLATGQAAASSWAAIPITGYTDALDATAQLDRPLHAQRVFIAGDASDPYMAQYWVARQNNLAPAPTPQWAAYAATACALVPAPAETALVLEMAAPGPALASMLQQRDTRLVRTYAVARGARFPLYQVTGSRPVSAPQATIPGAFQLDSTAFTALPGFSGHWLISRWTALSSTPPGPAVMEYSFQWTFSDPGGATTHQQTICAPTAWHAGEGMVLAVPAPAKMASGQGWHTALVVTRDTHTWYQPHLGPLSLETAKELTFDYVTLTPGPLQIAV